MAWLSRGSRGDTDEVEIKEGVEVWVWDEEERWVMLPMETFLFD